MNTVLVVGDAPRYDLGTSKPFDKAKCKKRLDLWLRSMSVDDYILCNRVDIDFNNRASWHFGPVIALGNEASRALSKIKVDHYKLPHPSGLNRLLNDKDYIVTKLTECKKYINKW